MRGNQDSRITLHTREKAADVSSFWSRDDGKFLVAAPFLLAAAIVCPSKRWHQCARLIESINGGKRKSDTSTASVTIISERLGVTSERLQEIFALSRINRTEHLIHAIHSLVRKNWCPGFRITGRQHIDEALAARKGAVLWVAHFTFASLFTKMALSQAGYAISHVSRPEHGVSKSQFGIRYLNTFRTAAENQFLSHRIIHQRREPKATKEAALAALRQNQLLSITVGDWEGRHVATGELLGARYAVATGGPALAFASGAELLPVFTTRDTDTGYYHVAIGAPLGKSARSSMNEFVQASTLQLLSQHEPIIREAPAQWRGWSKLLV